MGLVTLPFVREQKRRERVEQHAPLISMGPARVRAVVRRKSEIGLRDLRGKKRSCCENQWCPNLKFQLCVISASSRLCVEGKRKKHLTAEAQRTQRSRRVEIRALPENLYQNIWAGVTADLAVNLLL